MEEFNRLDSLRDRSMVGEVEEFQQTLEGLNKLTFSQLTELNHLSDSIGRHDPGKMGKMFETVRMYERMKHSAGGDELIKGDTVYQVLKKIAER